MHEHPHDTYLLTADVARLVGVTPAAVRSLTTRGRLAPVATTASGVRLYSLAAVEEYTALRARRRRRAAA